MDTPRHRALRPRYGRLTALFAATTVTAIALVGSWGGWDDEPSSALDAAARTPTSVTSGEPVRTPATVRTPAPRPTSPSSAGTRSVPEDPAVLPAASGSGRRVVFDQSAQRIWLVDETGAVVRSYLGSGSVTDNLRPGTYTVYSRSRWAVGVDDSGVMQYFVRFTRGPGGAAIGFHTIPTKHGEPVQRLSELGTPRSHGCIRQRTSDAVALWRFAPMRTTVVVVA